MLNSHKPETIFWQRFKYILLIAGVGILAMGGALKADYYMDDFHFIVEGIGEGPAEFNFTLFGQTFGSQSPEARATSLFEILPTLITVAVGWVAPVNSTASHAVNLLIHLALSILIFHQGRRLLTSLAICADPVARNQAALIGALIFACHPLGTEPVHYAKCHMVQLVALFGFWSLCEAVKFYKIPSGDYARRWAIVSVLCLMSYFPGTVLLAINTLILVIFAFLTPGKITWVKLKSVTFKRGELKSLRFMSLMGLLLLGVTYVTWYFSYCFYAAINRWGDQYPIHIVTQGRVFWEYVNRMIVPTDLASDHFQPWSSFQHPEAVFKLLGFALLFVICVAGALRKGNAERRGLFLMAVFALVPFAMRLLYVNIEIMVEYRAYSALPWVSLLAGCGLVKLAHRVPYKPWRWAPVGLIVMTYVSLSSQRGQIWRSSELLAEKSRELYPLNTRSLIQLQLIRLGKGDFKEVIRMHEEMLGLQQRISAENIRTSGKTIIDPIRSRANLIASCQAAVYAKSELEGYEKALKFADFCIAYFENKLPGAFESEKTAKGTAAWPLFFARTEIKRRLDAKGEKIAIGRLVTTP